MRQGTRILRRRQRGAALLTAMVIVVVVATLATSMLWQQWRSVQVESAERARTQSAWILAGALDWARLILREDVRSGGPPVDHLGEPWAVPLAEARLSSFLANGDANPEDAPDAFLSGAISDAQARYNLHNLIGANGIEPGELEVVQRLCESVGVSADVATRLASGLRDASPVPTSATAASGATATVAVTRSADAPLLPASTAQLAWLGIEPEAIRALAPYVTILPVTASTTTLNINTAPREAIAAVAGVDLATADRIVQTRQRTPLKSAADIKEQLPSASEDARKRLGVGSSYFEVRGRLRLADIVLEQRSLVWRRDRDTVLVLQRERVSARDPGT